MARTKNRPLPKGHLTLTQCLVFALGIGVISMIMLVFWVNLLTAVLTFLSLIGYAIGRGKPCYVFFADPKCVAHRHHLLRHPLVNCVQLGEGRTIIDAVESVFARK